MSSELRVDKIMPIDGIGNDTSHGHGAGNTSVQYGGGIIQVVQSLREGQFEQSFSSATNVMSATITPKFNTSKILVRYVLHICNPDAGSEAQVVRGSTAILNGTGTGHRRICDKSTLWFSNLDLWSRHHSWACDFH